MPGMKRDMGGAAALFGAFITLVRNGFAHNLHCLLCLGPFIILYDNAVSHSLYAAENSVSSDATRPDDIHTLFSGLTVEVFMPASLFFLSYFFSRCLNFQVNDTDAGTLFF